MCQTIIMPLAKITGNPLETLAALLCLVSFLVQYVWATISDGQRVVVKNTFVAVVPADPVAGLYLAVLVLELSVVPCDYCGRFDSLDVLPVELQHCKFLIVLTLPMTDLAEAA